MDSELDENEEFVGEDAVVPATAGQRLREAREKHGWDVAHVAAETRIPVRHLETVEASEFDELPSRTYAIGFARTYARTVGLDDREIASLVREELADGRERRSALAGGMEPGDPAKLPSKGLAWAGVAAAIVLAAGVVMFYQTYFAAGSNPESLLVQAEQEEREAQAAAAQQQQAAAATQTSAETGGQVVFTALEDNVWVRFYEEPADAERNVLFEGVMAQGDTFEVPGDVEEPLINTGRPDALGITIDGEDVAKLAEGPTTIGDARISAEALRARGETETVAMNTAAAQPPRTN